MKASEKLRQFAKSLEHQARQTRIEADKMMVKAQTQDDTAMGLGSLADQIAKDEKA